MLLESDRSCVAENGGWLLRLEKSVRFRLCGLVCWACLALRGDTCPLHDSLVTSTPLDVCVFCFTTVRRFFSFITRGSRNGSYVSCTTPSKRGEKKKKLRREKLLISLPQILAGWLEFQCSLSHSIFIFIFLY